MSTAGIYNYHPKVEYPSSVLPQMKSDTQSPPFYFGASQVPVALNIAHDASEHFKPSYNVSTQSIFDIPMKGHGLGVGLKTTHRKNDNIRIPKFLFHK